MFYLTTHSTHFIYGYMASDIWLRTILIVRKETRCRHIGYSYRLTARVLLYAPSHRQDNTYHGLCYTSCGALAFSFKTLKFWQNILHPYLPSFQALPAAHVTRARTLFDDDGGHVGGTQALCVSDSQLEGVVARHDVDQLQHCKVVRVVDHVLQYKTIQYKHFR